MISKGRVYVSAESLKKMFNLPDDVEFLTVERQDAHECQGGIEFVIASKEPIKGLTQETPSWNGLGIRRVRVPLEAEYFNPLPTAYGSAGSGKTYSTYSPQPYSSTRQSGLSHDYVKMRETSGFGVKLT